MLNQIAARLFPGVCPGCGDVADPLCTQCASTLRRPLPMPVLRGVDVHVAALVYGGVGRELVARLKYRNARAAIGFLTEAMLDAFPAVDVDVVTWVPTTRERVRGRGFDHAELLARVVARRLRLPVRPLLRRLPGPPQTGLSKAARQVGPRFEPRRTSPSRVLLIDDVATTGATLTAAAQALRAGGAGYVVALTAAHTPSPGALSNGPSTLAHKALPSSSCGNRGST